MKAAVNYVGSWFGSAPMVVSVNGKEVPVLTKLQALSQDFTKLSHGTLKWVNKAIDTYALPADHPFRLKVSQALEKTKAAGEKIAPAKQESDEPIVRQGLLTIQEMIDKIKNEGDNWTSVYLNNLNDELVKVLQETCPNLETLRIVARQDAAFLHLTDASVPYIAKMQKLKRFEYNAWNAFVGISQFDTLLSTAQFQTQMVEVSLMSPLISHTLLPILSKFTKLEKLYLWSVGMPEASIASIILPSSLKDLTLINSNAFPGTYISDALLKNIAGSTQLRSLSLGGVSASSDTQMQATINALPNLTAFSVQGPQLSPVSLLSLPNTLLKLNLGDCTLIDPNTFNTFFSMKKSLVSVTLQQANGFTDAQIKSLPPIKHFSVQSSNFLHLDGFPTSLESLEISGISWINPSAFKGLANLHLKSLRLLACPTFNDESLEHLISGTISSTLEGVEFYNSAFSSKLVPFLEQIPNLKIIMLGQCYSLGAKGAKRLFSSAVLASRITHLYLDSEVLHEDAAVFLNSWEKLRVVNLNNALGIPFKTQEKVFFHLRPIKENNGDVMLGLGEFSESYESFVHSI